MQILSIGTCGITSYRFRVATGPCVPAAQVSPDRRNLLARIPSFRHGDHLACQPPRRHIGFGVTQLRRALQRPNPARGKNADGGLPSEPKFIGKKSILYLRLDDVLRH